MDSNLTALLNRCQLVENTVNNIAKKYSPLLDAKLQTELSRLVNRAREYEHGTFIILVVGPAKSGKSTLVNLISGAYVSPTSFLECTVRPSVISRREQGQESSLTVYSATDTDTRLEQIDSIIDIIRGFGSEDDLSGVVCEKLPLTDENIRQRVQLGLEKSLDSENLLTSIRTPGGALLQERVFVIDMPGFDGAYQNIDNPVYETIAQRADLIIFVQSSNAAFSKVSKEFLNILARNNKTVPVCLVHNIFDAAWWRDADSKKKDVATQCQFACDKIHEMGFRIDPAHSFCINLGAVEDYRKGMLDSEGKLAEANAEFDVMEQKMYDSIINHRDSMRLTNSLSRVAQQRQKIIDKTLSQIESARALIEHYEAERQRLDNIKEQLKIAVPPLPQPNIELINQCIVSECNNQSRCIGLNIKKSNSDTNTLITNIIDSINTILTNEIKHIFKLNDISTDLYRVYLNHLTRLNNALGLTQENIEPEIQITIDAEFDVASHVDISNIVPKKKIAKIFNGSHTGEDIVEYIGIIRELLVPTSSQSLAPEQGVLVRTDVRRISDVVKDAVEKAVETYNNKLSSLYQSARNAILNSILPNPEATSQKLNTLTELCSDLKKLTI